jgi:hypothetical protein
MYRLCFGCVPSLLAGGMAVVMWFVETVGRNDSSDDEYLAYVSIRQHTSAYVSIRQHTSAYVSIRQHTSAYVSIRQHTSAYFSIRQHTSHTSAYVSIRQDMSAYVTAYVSIRQHTSAHESSDDGGLPQQVKHVSSIIFFLKKRST